MILATDVRAPSLFAEPRKIIDVDEATELLTAVLPDLDATEVRDRIGSRKGFVWLKREITPKQRAGNLQARPAGRRLPRREQARLSEQRRGVAPDRPRQHRQPGHRRHREMARRPRLAGAASRGACHRPAAEADRARRRSARAARAARRADLRRREIQGEGRRRPRRRCRDRRDRLDGVAAGLRSEQPEAGQRSAAHQPPDHRRVRARLDLQGADAGDGARFRQVHAQFDARCARARCTTGDSRSTTTTRRIACSACRRCSPIRRTSAPRGWRWHGRRASQVVPAEDGPARPAAHRAARKRRADRAQALGRAQHRDHRVRPRPVGRAAAGGRGDQRAGQRRLSHPADLHEAQQGRGDEARQGR